VAFADPHFWLSAVLSLVIFLLSLTVHEFAHARVAFALDDDTAARQRRMTLNPLAHIDLVGTILMPILGSAGVPVIGWAKPVPVNPLNFTRKVTMRGGMALVAVAGPLSNIVLALVSAGLLWGVVRSGLVPEQFQLQAVALLARLVFANIGLAMFNLLPIPPLDGSRLMPRSLDSVMEFLQRYTFIVFLVIIFFGGRFIAIPVILLTQLLGAAIGVDILYLYQLSEQITFG
jgi:Zn-dependent protease